MNISAKIKQLATSDTLQILKYLSRNGVTAKITDIKYDFGKVEPYEGFDGVDDSDEVEEISALVKIQDSSTNKQLSFKLEYEYDGEDIYSMTDERDLTNSILNKFGKSIKASRKIIAAAEDDLIDDDEFGFDDTEGVGDEIDDIADSVEDLQDSIDDMKEDDTNIEIDNNIANHYIVECDMCKRVFISAVVESDHEIENIKGICPICGKESEQYIKWIVRDVNNDDTEIE